ncbi:MAG: hypothetical protein PF690_13625 [Deltaproteobacteria bacterium]|jgi:hypothetical protein|nr:hypothetical protein [Deltaproteobacteria bacterium]
MLSEIYTLHKSLERCGIEPEKIHPWVTYHRRNDGFVVGINESGAIRRIEFHPQEKMAATWKLMPDFQRSFPVFNLKIPIWSPILNAEDIHQLLEEERGVNRFKELKCICYQAELYPHNKVHDIDKYIISLEKRFSTFPAKLQKKLKASHQENFIFLNLLARVQKIADSGQLFLQQLSDIAINNCMEGKLESWDVVEQLVLGRWHNTKKIYESGDISIVLDVDNYSDFECRVFDEEIKRHVSTALFTTERRSDSQDTCALSGLLGALERKKFPAPKLPILSQSYLFSMNVDTPCHYRYGKISVENYLVNKDLTNELYSCFLFITDPKRKGQTWCSVPGSDKKEKNLLISYLEKMPMSEIDFGFLGDDQNNEGQFEATAKIVCDALKGKNAISPGDQLRIFVLKSVDKGRRKVLFNSVFTVSNILYGVEIWRKGAKNHPPFSLVVPLKKGENPKAHNPLCPSPPAIMRLFHYQWIRNGLDNSAVQGCRLSDVFDLFFGSPQETRELCNKFLKLLMRQTHPLLLGIGGALNTETIKKYSIEAKKSTLFAISLLAILLYKLGFKKEEYMEGEAFKVGKILSLADTLHKEYGKIVRKDIPAQLLGNAMMRTALDNPQHALARLNQRLLVYKAWADKGGEEAKLAKWAVNEMGKVAQTLEESDLSFRPDEAAQAKMLLGYLARSGKNEKNAKEKKDNDK